MNLCLAVSLRPTILYTLYIHTLPNRNIDTRLHIL